MRMSALVAGICYAVALIEPFWRVALPHLEERNDDDRTERRKAARLRRQDARRRRRRDERAHGAAGLPARAVRGARRRTGDGARARGARGWAARTLCPRMGAREIGSAHV